MFDINNVITRIQPQLEQLETFRLQRIAERKRKRRNIALFVGIPLIVFLVVIYVSIENFLIFATIILVLSFPIAFVSVAVYVLIKSKEPKNDPYNYYYKTTVIPALLQTIDPNLQYYPTSGIQEMHFRNSELFRSNMAGTYASEDLIRGSYGQTELLMAECSTLNPNVQESKQNYFQGIMLIADFHKSFNGRTFITQDIVGERFGSIGRKFQSIIKWSNTELIQFEDSEFEEMFAVYSTNQVEARYILSTSMMRNIIQLQKRFSGRKIKIAFKNSVIYVAIPYKATLFEPNQSKPATDTTQIYSQLKEIGIFLAIVDELNLNTRIWSKQ